MPSAPAPAADMIHFGTVARGLLREQTQYAYRYLDGLHGSPELGADLRYYTCPNGDYHATRIHPNDVFEFVSRVAHHRAAVHSISNKDAEVMLERARAWTPVAEDFET